MGTLRSPVERFLFIFIDEVLQLSSNFFFAVLIANVSCFSPVLIYFYATFWLNFPAFPRFQTGPNVLL